jgi:hypothetical protein
MQGLISGLLSPCSQRPLCTVCSGKRWGGGGCLPGGLAVSTRGRRGLPPVRGAPLGGGPPRRRTNREGLPLTLISISHTSTPCEMVEMHTRFLGTLNWNEVNVLVLEA